MYRNNLTHVKEKSKTGGGKRFRTADRFQPGFYFADRPSIEGQ